jgi:DNA invertase Pin-like site-specific DNA recombinase
MTKAYAYLRVSGKGQVEGDGFPRQLEAVTRHAAAHGIKIEETFQEKGVSGTLDGMERPGWVEMIAKILANGVRTILIEKLDRLARDLMIQEHILSDLQRQGITLISVAEPDLCSNDPSRVLMRQIMGAIAQYEKTMIVAKLRAARQRARVKNGRCEGAKPYGSLPGEAVVLARIKEMRRGKATYREIASTLNAEAVSPRGLMGHGSGVPKWHPSSVARVIHR